MTSCQFNYAHSICTGQNFTNYTVQNSTTFNGINQTYFCGNNGGNMTPEQQVKDAIKKGGAGLWIGIGVGVGACLLISVAVCYCRNKNKNDHSEGGEKESRTIFKASIKSKNVHRRETKENLVPANSIHPEEEI